MTDNPSPLGANADEWSAIVEKSLQRTLARVGDDDPSVPADVLARTTAAIADLGDLVRQWHRRGLSNHEIVVGLFAWATGLGLVVMPADDFIDVLVGVAHSAVGAHAQT